MGSRTPPTDKPQRNDEELHPLRVLLVDDDIVLVRTLKAGLEAEGLSVVTAGTGAETIALMANPNIDVDVLVMDLELPDSWGSQVAMECTRYRPDVPVVFISGKAREDAIIAASTLGDVGPFLAKPFAPDDLAALVRQVHEDKASKG